MEAMDGSKQPNRENQSNRIRPLDFTDLLDTLGTIVSAETKAATEASPDQMRAALILGSPDFMRR
jgi:hypothetical protein